MASIIFLVALVVIVQSCYYDNEEELYPGADCGIENVTFSADILPLVQANCAISGCHVAGTGRTILTEHARIKAVADNGQLNQRVFISKDMPPSGPLSSCQMKVLKAWIEQGAPNN